MKHLRGCRIFQYSSIPPRAKLPLPECAISSRYSSYKHYLLYSVIVYRLSLSLLYNLSIIQDIGWRSYDPLERIQIE